jgi:hypothetical protein
VDGNELGYLGLAAPLVGAAIGIFLWLSGRIRTAKDYDEVKGERDYYLERYHELLASKGAQERELLDKFGPLIWEANKTAEAMKEGLQGTIERLESPSPRRNDVDTLVRRLELTVDRLSEGLPEGGR